MKGFHFLQKFNEIAFKENFGWLDFVCLSASAIELRRQRKMFLLLILLLQQQKIILNNEKQLEQLLL